MFEAIIVFLIVLSILILVHELGHFIVARAAGVMVEEFGWGLPPRIWGKKIGETTYSINLLPFGGFVKLFGEDEVPEKRIYITYPTRGQAAGRLYATRAFINKPKKVRAAIILAGVVMNFLLAVAAFSIVYSFSGFPKETKNVRVVDVSPGSPAQVAGILVGDIVRKVDKEEVSSVSQFVDLVEEKKGNRTVLVVEREEEMKNITISPRESPPEGEGPLGVTISSTEIYYPPLWQRPIVGIYYGFREAVFWGRTVIDGFIKIFADLFAGQAPKDIAGPVGIFAVTSEAAKVGILALVNFVGILSVNLAILNIIPFPALDGGRLLFIGIETFLGRKVVPKIESAVHTIGMVILLILLLAITAHDIQRLIAAGGVSGFLDQVLK